MPTPSYLIRVKSFRVGKGPIGEVKMSVLNHSLKIYPPLVKDSIGKAGL